MGRLIGYGTGEIVDRLSILALKIQLGKPEETLHFRDERSALLNKLGEQAHVGALGNITISRDDHKTTLWRVFFDLSTINGMLWRAEDDLRSNRNCTEADRLLGIAGIAYEIQHLNDQRARCIREINQLTGEHAGHEKLVHPTEADLA